MKRLKELLWKYKHAIVLLYFPVYMTWFMLLENRSGVKYTYIHCKIDDLIPFCEYFIIPYLLWFAYVLLTLLVLFFQVKHVDDFYRTAATLLLGMTTCLVIYTFFPNGQNMRPTTFERDNFFTHIVAALYTTDTSTNVFPSIHVYNSLAIHVGITHSHFFQNKKGWCRASLILCILICLSTMFLKQHSFLDGVTAAGLYIVYYTIIYKPYRKIAESEPQKSIQS